MGVIKTHPQAKLVIGFISADIKLIALTEQRLSKEFGHIDLESPIWDFTHTDYYKQEFGDCLKRKFVTFKRLIKPEDLYKIKIKTNSIELQFSKSGARKINIDPGYIDTSKLILATTKDYSHRIYLKKGIYAEVTLFYKNHQFNPWPWTYPDYKQASYIEFFNNVRSGYLLQSKNRQ